MGLYAKLSFPTVDVIAQRVAKLINQHQVYLFKVDLSDYFCQLSLDPGDYSLLYFTWDGLLYFDVVSPMGLHSAPYFVQHTSNAIRQIHNNMGYFLFNYIDNFIGVEIWSRINSSFNTFIRVLHQIGIKESVEKRVCPTKKLNCVGTLVDAENRQLEILPEHLCDLHIELDQWVRRKTCTVKGHPMAGG